MFSRLPTSRFSRPVASWISPTIACWNTADSPPRGSLRLLAALVIAAMGVRISWEMELSSVLLRRSDSATSLACCSASRRRCRSSTSAIWRTKASSRSRWAGASGLASRNRKLSTPTARSPATSGRCNPSAEGRVSVPRPAGWRLRKAQEATLCSFSLMAQVLAK